MVNRERPFNIHDLRLTRTGGPMINQERIKNLLLELVQIDSHSRKEREVAQRIKSYCEEMGAQVEIDDAGEKVGGNTGNVIARFAGTIQDAEPIMMSESEEHTSELQSRRDLVCRLLLEKKKKKKKKIEAETNRKK